MIEFYYHYKAKVLRIVDGDTLDMEIDLGFNTFCHQRIRPLGYDTPERGELGFSESSEELAKVLAEAKDITVYTVKKDSFGRWLAWIWADGENVCEYMFNYVERMTPLWKS